MDDRPGSAGSGKTNLTGGMTAAYTAFTGAQTNVTVGSAQSAQAEALAAYE